MHGVTKAQLQRGAGDRAIGPPWGPPWLAAAVLRDVRGLATAAWMSEKMQLFPIEKSRPWTYGATNEQNQPWMPSLRGLALAHAWLHFLLCEIASG